MMRTYDEWEHVAWQKINLHARYCLILFVSVNSVNTFFVRTSNFQAEAELRVDVLILSCFEPETVITLN